MFESLSYAYLYFTYVNHVNYVNKEFIEFKYQIVNCLLKLGKPVNYYWSFSLLISLKFTYVNLVNLVNLQFNKCSIQVSILNQIQLNLKLDLSLAQLSPSFFQCIVNIETAVSNMQWLIELSTCFSQWKIHCFPP